MPVYYSPSGTANSAGDSFSGHGVSGMSDPGSTPYAVSDPARMDAKYFGEPLESNVLGLWTAAVGEKDYRILWACPAGLSVGQPCRINGAGTLALATADTEANSKAIGFVRQKATTTTCWISHFHRQKGCVGFSASDVAYLSDTGTFAPAQGTIKTVIGVCNGIDLMLCATPTSFQYSGYSGASGSSGQSGFSGAFSGASGYSGQSGAIPALASGDRKIKASGTTRTSADPIAIDPDLSLTVVAGKSYAIDGVLLTHQAYAGDQLKVKWEAAGGGTIDINLKVFENNYYFYNNEYLEFSGTGGSGVSGGCNAYVAGAYRGAWRVSGYFKATLSGTLDLWWTGSSINAVTLREGSWIECNEGAGAISGASGLSGAVGLSGFSGAFSGQSGTSGESGSSGCSGFSGTYSGYSGESGFSSGVPGPQGLSGSSGSSGGSGSSGESGASGISGQEGYSGASGLPGDSGFSGFSGIDGSVGSSGGSGSSGKSGASGSSGASGATGLQGTSGDSGVSGAVGMQGVPGDSGTSGASGPSGFSGLGLQGTSGDSGFSGRAAGAYLVSQPGHTFVPGDVVYRTTGLWDYAKADNIGTAEALAIVQDVTGDLFDVIWDGPIAMPVPQGWTDGEVYFISESVAGQLTLTEPSTPGVVSKPMLVATSANTGIVLSYRGMVVPDPLANSGYSGYSGASGLSGLTGPIGLSGGSGQSGTSGARGYTGTSGTSGLKGDSGSSGESGLSGGSGYSGTSGKVGPIGLSGTSGTSGQAGPKGDSGTSGYSGKSGASGESGASGVGTSGYSGAKGISGTSGFKGDSGTSGNSGASGLKGDSGLSGAIGVSGTSGLKGDSGLSGAKGTSGDSGASGSQGYSGTSGFSGTYSGASGESGSSGATGSGLSGTSGASGSSGESGVSGKSGTSGASGTSGTSGFKGDSGTSGPSGQSGESGTSGAKGSSGDSGSSGSSGTSGFKGDSGISGESGMSGSSGGSGFTGASGASGSSGISGLKGDSGDSGGSGSSGSSGSSGWSGFSAVGSLGNNVIINGDFNVWQRGTSFPAIAKFAFSADRWTYNNYTTTVIHTASQDASVPTQAQSGHRSSYSLKTAVTTADASVGAADISSVEYVIECQDAAMFFDQPFTLSFWARDAKTGTHCVSFRDGHKINSYVAEYTINAANTWERQAITIPAMPNSAWCYGSRGLMLSWPLICGSNYQTGSPNTWILNDKQGTASMVNSCDAIGNAFHLAQVKLEPGSVATQFTGEEAGVELVKCQRYCIVYGGNALYEQVGMGVANSVVLGNSIQLPLPTSMRATPSVSYSAVGDWSFTSGVGNTPCTSIAVNYPSPNNGALRVFPGLAAPAALLMTTNNTLSARLWLTAEIPTY